MRNINNFFLDSSGLPATGSISFYKNGTQTTSNVYDASGNVLSQPIQVANGTTKVQIFLSDEDVYVVPTFNKAYVDKRPVFAISTEGVSIPAFTNVEDMQEAEGLEEGDVVMLTGYFESGDKPAVYYTFHEGTEVGDGGSIIATDNNTYFELIEPDVIDVRHWGVFGYNTIALAHTNANTGGITNASSYASSRKKKLHFPDNNFYQVVAGTYDCDGGMLFTSTASSVTIRSSTTKGYNDSTYNGRFHFSNDLVRASQMANCTQYAPTLSCKDYIFDALVQINVERCNVYGRTNAAFTSQHTWTNVNLYGTQFITSSNLNIHNSFIDPVILSSSLTIQQIGTMFTHCRTDKGLWSDTTKYNAFMGNNRQDQKFANVDALAASVQTLTASSSVNSVNATISGILNVANINITDDITAVGGNMTGMEQISADVLTSSESRGYAVNRKSCGEAVRSGYVKFHEGTDYNIITDHTPECFVSNVDSDSVKNVCVGVVTSPSSIAGRCVWSTMNAHTAGKFYRGEGYSSSGTYSGATFNCTIYWTKDDGNGTINCDIDEPYN